MLPKKLFTSLAKSGSVAVRDATECVDALINAVESTFPDLELTIHVLLLIAELVPYGKFAQKLCWALETHKHSVWRSEMPFTESWPTLQSNEDHRFWLWLWQADGKGGGSGALVCDWSIISGFVAKARPFRVFGTDVGRLEHCFFVGVADVWLHFVSNEYSDLGNDDQRRLSVKHSPSSSAYGAAALSSGRRVWHVKIVKQQAPMFIVMNAAARLVHDIEKLFPRELGPASAREVTCKKAKPGGSGVNLTAVTA